MHCLYHPWLAPKAESPRYTGIIRHLKENLQQKCSYRGHRFIKFNIRCLVSEGHCHNTDNPAAATTDTGNSDSAGRANLLWPLPCTMGQAGTSAP